MSQMNCSEMDGRVDAYLADELEGSELRAVIAHLAVCPDCRRRAEAGDSLKMFVPLAAREGQGGERWDGFWEEIAEKIEPRSPRRGGRLIPWPGTMRWVAAAAAGAVAAVALLGIFLVQQGAGPGQVPAGPPTAEVQPAEEGAGDLVEEMYINRIAGALPAQLIERRGEVRELHLTRIDERSSGTVNHYRSGGRVVPATVSDVQAAEQMESIIEYSLVIAEDAGSGESEEVRVVSFESEQFPFGCEAVRNPEEQGAAAGEAMEKR